MIHYIFDLDDTLIIHQKGVPINYDMIIEDNLLKKLLDNCNAECYIYTNGTFNHAFDIIKSMNIINTFFKIYSRDTLSYMKPDMRSFNSVQNDIQIIYPKENIIYFFDDLLENCETAKSLGWTTFWINPNYLYKHHYDFVDYAFKNIKDALIYLEKTNIE